MNISFLPKYRGSVDVIIRLLHSQGVVIQFITAGLTGSRGSISVVIRLCDSQWVKVQFVTTGLTGSRGSIDVIIRMSESQWVEGSVFLGIVILYESLV